MFINRDFTRKLSIHALRAENIHISIPSRPNADALIDLSAYKYKATPVTDFDEMGAIEGTPSVSGDVATQTWIETPLSSNDKTDLKQQKFNELNNDFTVSVQSLDKKYSDTEQRSFDQQRNEAEAWQTSNSTSTPRLERMALSRGITTEQMIRKVLTRLDDIDVIYWNRLGHKQKLSDEVKSLADDDVNFKSKLRAIKW